MIHVLGLAGHDDLQRKLFNIWLNHIFYTIKSALNKHFEGKLITKHTHSLCKYQVFSHRVYVIHSEIQTSPLAEGEFRKQQ